MKIVIDIPEEIRLALINNIQLSMDQQSMCDSYIKQAIVNGIPLSELNDKWKSSYEQMLQEKICELDKRKNELENQLNISIQNNIAKEMNMCCSEGK